MAAPLIPTTNEGKRLHALFSRRETTSWTLKEVQAFKRLKKSGCFDNLDDLRLIECYYVFQRQRPDGIHRRDLMTLLNNWSGELDRARAWQENEANKKLIRAGDKARGKREETCYQKSDLDFKQAGEMAHAMVQQLRQQLFPQV